MTWKVRVVRDAEAELEISARWYDERAGLRTEFIEAIDEAVFAIAEGQNASVVYHHIDLSKFLWRLGE